MPLPGKDFFTTEDHGEPRRRDFFWQQSGPASRACDHPTRFFLSVALRGEKTVDAGGCSHLADEPLQVVVALDLREALGLAREKLVHGLVAAGPGRVVVLVEEDDAARRHARMEELQALPVRRVDVAVEMDERELP